MTIFKVVSKSLFSKPATRKYPFEKREPYANTRGHIVFTNEGCTFCTLCAKLCPTEAIVVNRKEKIWEIDRRKCILCGACTEGCRKGALSCDNHYAPPFSDEKWLDYDRNTGLPEHEIECANSEE